MEGEVGGRKDTTATWGKENGDIPTAVTRPRRETSPVMARVAGTG